MTATMERAIESMAKPVAIVGIQPPTRPKTGLSLLDTWTKTYNTMTMMVARDAMAFYTTSYIPLPSYERRYMVPVTWSRATALRSGNTSTPPSRLAASASETTRRVSCTTSDSRRRRN